MLAPPPILGERLLPLTQLDHASDLTIASGVSL